MPPRPFPFPFRVGTDICNVSRLRGVITRRYDGDPTLPLRQFLKRVFTDHERQYFWKRFGPTEDVLAKTEAISAFLAGRFAAKEACRKACDHLDKNARGFQHIMILPVTSLDRSEHQSSRPQGLILDALYEAQARSTGDSTYTQDAGIEDGPRALVDIAELEGQLCEISISHDGGFATAVAIVPSMKGDSGWSQDAGKSRKRITPFPVSPIDITATPESPCSENAAIEQPETNSPTDSHEVPRPIILFEDVKRTEPFARLAKAPKEGTSAYGTILQTPRAWWSIFMDTCFRRKVMGKTSWSLICAAIVNILSLLAISPLSSALLSSEEIRIPRPTEFTRLVPRNNTRLPALANRDTYFRTMAAIMRNTTTSAWITDTSLTFPFWPSSEAAQLGPKLTSLYDEWSTESTTFNSDYDCREMKLESADIREEPYSNVWDVMRRYPRNGTQPMVKFVLSSDQGCRYELMLHPMVDLAYNGGITWSEADTFFPLPSHYFAIGFGTPPIPPNVTSTNIYARLNATKECNGHDILLMSTPWTAPLDWTPYVHSPFIPENLTYERSPDFRMQGKLCRSSYSMSRSIVAALLTQSVGKNLGTNAEGGDHSQELPDSLVDIPKFQKMCMQDNWNTYFDGSSMASDAKHAAPSTMVPLNSNRYPGYSGMAPMLAAISDFDLVSLMDDPDIVRKAARVKGRFFMETVRETLDSPDLIQTDDIQGNATLIQERVIVLTEIGFTLAALFFASATLFIAILWTSRLSSRPLNLNSDPASTVGLSLLLQPRLARVATLRSMHNASRRDLYSALQKESFLTSEQSLVQGSAQTTASFPPIKAKRDWRPRVIHLRTLVALGILLISIVTAILTLNAFSIHSRLSQAGFTYEADISRLNLSFPTFAPISIAPTVASIVIGLWWDQLDMTFRILQPYISMSQGPTPINAGAGLTYRSKSWVGAALKAARYKHWVLLLVTTGSVLSQVLTVSMSALFERTSTTIARNVTLHQSLEIRRNPLISEIGIEQETRYPYEVPMSVLGGTYLNVRKNWLYGAGIRHAFNGSDLSWASGGWNFLPVDLSHVPLSKSSLYPSDTSGTSATVSTNVSMNVPAIKARLECNPVEQVSTTSSWLGVANLTDENLVTDEHIARLNSTGGLELYYLTGVIFENSSSQTTVLSDSRRVACCANGTSEQPRRNVIGYWSPATPNGEKFPFTSSSWPLSIVTKWIVGNAIAVENEYGERVLYYTEKPKMQAARCEPIIETTEATISVDARSGSIISYDISSPVTSIDHAWAEVFTEHEVTSGVHGPFGGLTIGAVNVTTSFGVLFVLSMLMALSRESGIGIGSEQLNQNAYAFRNSEKGINTDLMTNTMFALADEDPEVLLNYQTLANLADRTFQSFFQEFANSGLSLKEGGYAYQPIDDQSMKDLGQSIHANRISISERGSPGSNANRNITASVSNRIRLLHMNSVATYLSTAILVWLIGTTLVIICVQRRYTSSMIRDVKLIADMLVLVAGSDEFLELVQERGVALKKDKEIRTMLGWFKDRDGDVRWGVEVVGGREAVEWVDAPKTGNPVREKNIIGNGLIPWSRD
ncbi:hypothetical protein DDE82_006204 [Stemphylium lycopersici]|nr:hypothetical protein DDE82_006204 [Stemphylium lycopersici]